MLNVNLPLFKIDDKVILEDLEFSLTEGENLTILGANGAGKSTLAKLLCGILKSKNQIELEGELIESISDDKRSKLINYIPPKLSIYDTFITVYDFLALNRHPSKIDEVLALLGLEKFETNYCQDLSSGEQQLLLLASALIEQSQLTIFDEPTSNLDPKKTKQLFETLKSSHYLTQKIIITHDLQFAWKLNYPILYLSDGKATWFKSAEAFFSTQNLEQLFSGSVVKEGDKVVVDL
ncbi:MAG: ABC transporter ATP-binding protein [Epsilonproteobacteria bacterium]|nr:ABC transporter ATP-binding protein [Campylobacterota bacterium]